MTRLARVGYDHAIGYLKGGIQSWQQAGKQVDTIRSISAEEFASRFAQDPGLQVVDVRKPGEYLSEHVETALNTPLDYLNEHLARFDQDLTSIEVQLTDENHATKGGGVDKRCMMEARLQGHQPIAVTHHADSYELAINGAASKLKRSLQNTIGRLRDH